MANQIEQNPKKSASAAKANKPNVFVRMGRKLKEVFSELKRVTWPTFPKVVRGTCVVLVVVVVFTVIVTGINYGLQALLNVITGIGA